MGTRRWISVGLRSSPSIAVAAVLLVAAETGTLSGQSRPGVKLAAGQFLVANSKLSDPNFYKTVVLLAQYSEKGAMGLIINRSSGVAVSRVLSQVEPAKGRTEPIYIGGPVGRTGVLALLRSHASLGTRVFADVYLISSRNVLEKTLAAGAPASDLRIYSGYAGWGIGQLDMEVAIGMWHVMAGDAGLVFDPKPETLWNRLIDRFEGLRAKLSEPACVTHSPT